MVEVTKICGSCNTTLPLSSFYPHKRMKLGVQPWCKICSRKWHRDRPEYIRKKNAEWRAKNPTYSRDWQRKRNYGLSPADVDRIRDLQNGKCLCCNIDLAISKECVDHCHETGKVRGLLCNRCNVVIGMMNEDVNSINRMAAYISNWSATQLELQSRKEAEEW